MCSLWKWLQRGLLLTFLYVLFKITSCFYYGPIVYKTFNLTPWELFKNRLNRFGETPSVYIKNKQYFLCGSFARYLYISLDTKLSEEEREDVYRVVQELLTNKQNHKCEHVPSTSGLAITFMENWGESIRLWFTLTENGFSVAYQLSGSVFGVYPVSLISGSHLPETQRLWSQYGNMKRYLPLSEKCRKYLRENREYDPRMLNLLDDSLVEEPFWEPEFGVMEE